MIYKKKERGPEKDRRWCMLFRNMSRKRKAKAGAVPVHLNVYDLTSMNGYAYWFGLGIYHSGVQVHGIEYAFGAHQHSTSGIFEVEPKRCPGFTFRKSILIGRIDLSPREVQSFMEKLAKEYYGNTYNLITKNCNHFCDNVCMRLTSKAIPRWVNRLALLGLLCNCVLPLGLNENMIQHIVVEEGDMEKKKLRSSSTRFCSSGQLQSAKTCAVDRHQNRHSSSAAHSALPSLSKN